ncbi:MAG: penicillin-binding protein [Chitinophagales bacterium]|nr:MAG: penicillin-binding protein [Chitinophagales bacterium]
MSIKRSILARIYITFFFLCLMGAAILFKVIHIQQVEGKYLISLADSLTTDYLPIEAERGNVLTEDGQLLATSLPFFEIRADLNAEALTDNIFYSNVDSLAWHIAQFKKDKPATYYKQMLVNARKMGNRYLLIEKNITYPELQQIKQWPLFRMGRYKGGLIVIQESKRTRPYQILAHRTIGYVREGIKPVGLEGRFNEYLAGVSGKRLMQRIAGGTWIPVNDENEIMPENGKDIVTTIDINLQDVAENALYKALQKHNADHGSVVVMEVATGKIRAIANLGKIQDGSYWENYNYAIGEATEPGSTIKLAALIALLEDGFIDLDDSVDLERGVTGFHDKKMYDSEQHDYRYVSVKRAFEISSNVGISKLVYKYYGKHPQKYIEYLRKLHLHEKVGIEIEGEPNSFIKDPTNKDWSGVSLPWMSVGYEMMITPLRILTLYNAIANDGRMMKPYLVSAVTQRGKVIKEFEPEVIEDKICSDRTLRKVKLLLEGVVSNGTASHLQSRYYTFAGKTGTAKIADKNRGYAEIYQASFVGYFPAQNPIYSCIVVINEPKNGMYYGGHVAGPVFREIADKVFSTCLEMHEPVNQRNYFIADELPHAKSGYRADISNLYEAIGVSCNYRHDDEWVYVRQKDNSLDLRPYELKEGYVPDVRGMGLRDALYLLENLGMKVHFTGVGKVKSQSIRHGTRVNPGMQIMLELG